MTKRMLIDATHAEETRVVVLDGNRLEDFDVETSTKKQLKGNIYLAKVVRVEPSLQAAFVDYGGNRHGFLAFSEIHPDYYQIPVADRQRLIEAEAEEARREEEEEDRAALESSVAEQSPVVSVEADGAEQPETPGQPDEPDPELLTEQSLEAAQPLVIEAETLSGAVEIPPTPDEAPAGEPAGDMPADVQTTDAQPTDVLHDDDGPAVAQQHAEPRAQHDESIESQPDAPDDVAAPAETESYDRVESLESMVEAQPPETVGGDLDGAEDARERRIPSRLLRTYKIQEVIKRRQILLVQVVKEERGTKGAALTTYLSLAGRFGVLMPNSPRGGGISRKITSAADRRRLKEIMAELEIPQGMGMIVRTAGANRPKPEIKRDCEYLLRLWDEIRDHTLKSVAPALIYEEASLIKRAIRDVYSRDIDEILVDGEEGWHAAHDFMRMLMPSHAKKVQLWRDAAQPLFAKSQVEAQLDAMLLPTVQLRSGGYLVINQAEALVAIDVNSGRSTRERGIEETALRTNMEAADEVARQLRLRDLAGLIVIDFIDMESRKHNAMVERRLKEALKNDRARIQVGQISHFGLMEMSRQRLRPSLAETSFIACPHCGGTGHVRSTESAAVHVLRGIEEEGAKRRAAEIVVYVATPIALYILNHKRDRLREIELRYAMRVMCQGDDTQLMSQFRIDRLRPQIPGETPLAITQEVFAAPEEPIEAEEPAEEPDIVSEAEAVEVEEEDQEEGAEAARPVAGETAEEAEQRRRRRRRRRRGTRRDEPRQPEAADAVAAAPTEPTELVDGAEVDAAVAETQAEGLPAQGEAAEAGDDEHRARRRGRRGGRRRRPDGADQAIPVHAEPGADQPDLPPVYAGPTPANPFGGHAFDIFDVLEQAEANAVPAAVAIPAAVSVSVAVPELVSDAEPEPAPPEPEPVAMSEPEPAPVVEAVAEPEPVAAPVEELVAPVMAVEAVMVHPVANGAEPEPVPEPAAANDAEPGPAIQPILIGTEAAEVVEKKRGWWRR